MKLIRFVLFISALLFIDVSLWAQGRSVIDFNNGWKFLPGNDSLSSHENHNDSKWRSVNLPHDWSIEHDFSAVFPATNQGGALPGGIGWYRKTFMAPPGCRNKNTRIEFDGVYRNSEVWINGHYLGKRPNGYVSFQYDITPYLWANRKNVIAVKVDNSNQPDSRWYTGSGIYRNVRMVVTQKIAVADGATFISTPVVTANKAVVSIRTIITNTRENSDVVDVLTEIYDEKNIRVGVSKKTSHLAVKKGGNDYLDEVEISRPKLWSVQHPHLYRAIIKIRSHGQPLDACETVFGVRQFSFDPVAGFFLNHEPLKIKGVCMHHDLGALGAAVNTSAMKRQLVILKEMGCNAIRTAHNPPAPEFLELCDQMGFLVMDEAFDMWKRKKNKFDYAKDFEAWHQRDLEAMVLRDRNHPSVIMWSIGNEIGEQFDSSGITIARKLVSIVKALDTTRPVLSALTENIPQKNFIYQSGAMDVLGFNYKMYDYGELPKRFPGQGIFAAETASALATRGVYDMPSDSVRFWPPDSKKPFLNGHADMTVSAYDHVYAYWGSSHEQALAAMKKYPFMAGMFVWSGFDFLGEPLPYAWPARSSYYGIIDLAGFPKDVYYLYQSEWTTKPVLHIFPHWNWTPGKLVDVWAYFSNADEVELFLNNRSLGIRKKDNHELHVMWRIPFEPGTLKAVSRKDGRVVLTSEIKTAGKAHRVELSADRLQITANGKDISFITAKVVDSNGNLVPDADPLIKFSVLGEGKIAGTDNGFQADSLSLKSPERKAWKGLAMAMIQAGLKKGNITVIAKAAGLSPAVITLKTAE